MPGGLFWYFIGVQAKSLADAAVNLNRVTSG